MQGTALVHFAIVTQWHVGKGAKRLFTGEIVRPLKIVGGRRTLAARAVCPFESDVGRFVTDDVKAPAVGMVPAMGHSVSRPIRPVLRSMVSHRRKLSLHTGQAWRVLHSVQRMVAGIPSSSSVA